MEVIFQLSPLRRDRHHFFGHGHGDDESGDVPPRGDGSYLRDKDPCGGEVGQEEVRGNRIVGTRRHSQLMGLSGQK
jgi:hypothetical protein